MFDRLGMGPPLQRFLVGKRFFLGVSLAGRSVVNPSRVVCWLLPFLCMDERQLGSFLFSFVCRRRVCASWVGSAYNQKVRRCGRLANSCQDSPSYG